ncbi:hypothetical protein SteCoe_24684 [Stentor coeruleus]|uniref:Uncharacterized protein n=1 Tax=Stentor coeruleus TaxID=5963 RepID=A0A1R2BGY8_9CILI|nr:hypothetical protein SteCoe_24684 [Stentor coeruleus]
METNKEEEEVNESIPNLSQIEEVDQSIPNLSKIEEVNESIPNLSQIEKVMANQSDSPKGCVRGNEYHIATISRRARIFYIYQAKRRLV